MRLILFTLLASLAIVKGDIFGISKNLLGNILNTANKLLEGFGDKKPLESICGKYECPTYTVKFKKAHYELRCYENAHWVSVKSDHSLSRGASLFGGGRKMFKQLFSYIDGSNSLGAKINMTVPVLQKIKDDGTSLKLKMSFYIPRKFQTKPPSPTNPNVIVESNKFCAYVHSFGGFTILYSQVEKHVEMLMKALKEDGLQDTYKSGTYLYAGYNKPTTIFNRHNEVMLLRK